MQLKDFEYVLKIAETHNLSRAAEELFIAQSTLSHALNRIEAEVGAPLFDRSRIPLTVTVPGEIYIEKARQILNINMEIKNQISDISNYQRSKITIGITRFLQFYYLPTTIPMLRKKYPDMKINIVVETPPNLATMMANGKFDVAFMPPLVQDGIKNKPIFDYKALVMMAKSNPLAKNYKKINGDYPIINFTELKDEDFLLITDNHFLRSAFFQLCKKYGLAPRVGLEMDSFMALLSTISHGYGVTILPEAMLKFAFDAFDAVGANDIAAFKVKDATLTYPIALVYPDSKYIPPAIQDIIHYAPSLVPPL